jgi:DNA polymerase-2
MRYDAAMIYLRSSSGPRGEQIIIQGRLSDGRNYGILIDDFSPRFYLPHTRLPDALQSLAAGGIEPLPYGNDEPALETMGGKALSRLRFKTAMEMTRAHRVLRDQGFPCYEGDFSPSQQFLIDAGIGLFFSFEAPPESGDRVDIRARNPRLLPMASEPESFPIRILALDIETTREGSIRSISLVFRDSNRGALARHSEDMDLGAQIPVSGKIPGDQVLSLDRGLKRDLHRNGYEIREYPSERELLEDFHRIVREGDPDIITGWNVISFDMAVILGRMEALGVAGDFGRSRESARFLPGSGDMPDHCEVPGRGVIDSMRLQRMHPAHFESYSLESVAGEVLGRGKSEQFSRDGKMEALDRLWEDDPERFLFYCLEDSRLVIDILAETGLMELTVKRAVLCGTTLTRSWASIHAFEQLYAARLHARGIAAPDHGVDALPMNESPGGTIIFPESGMFAHVLLLDFKGLYPSIMRSFGIDPLAHIRASGAADIIRSPNGAAFALGIGILPELLTEFYHLREAAKARGDQTASFAYKILANSFYGVLGSPGCRFAGSDIATAITSFAREILHWSQRYAEEKGFRAIYGDTDSLFLVPPPDLTDRPDFDPQELFGLGEQLTSEINRDLGTWVRDEYSTESFLEIEFETLFAPLYIPPLKSVGSDAVSRSLREAGLESPQGRAKSYAGISWNLDRLASGEQQVVIKGMETVRSDWTPFARNAQRRVLVALLTGGGESEVRRILQEIIKEAKRGGNKSQLTISKRLSKAAHEYRGNLPPHVRAALHAEKSRKGKRPLRSIRYVMSPDGPLPVMDDQALERAVPDMNWYIEKQLLPVLKSVNAAADFDLEALCNAIHPPDGQGELW